MPGGYADKEMSTVHISGGSDVARCGSRLAGDTLRRSGPDKHARLHTLATSLRILAALQRTVTLARLATPVRHRVAAGAPLNASTRACAGAPLGPASVHLGLRLWRGRLRAAVICVHQCAWRAIGIVALGVVC